MKDKKETHKKNGFKNIFQQYKQLFVFYLVGIALSTVMVMVLRPEPLYNAVSIAIGISGTFASLYSIFVSKRDELRSKEEFDDNKAFLKLLSENINLVLNNTILLRTDFTDFVDFHNNAATKAQDESKEVTPEEADGNWKEPDDEVKPT